MSRVYHGGTTTTPFSEQRCSDWTLGSRRAAVGPNTDAKRRKRVTAQHLKIGLTVHHSLTLLKVE